MKLRTRSWSLLSLTLTLVAGTAFAEDLDFDAFSLEELTTMEITSASKRKERLADTSSAVFVITSDDIRRSGHTSIPELLRLVPGLQVERIDNSNYSLSIRGFEDLLANKLLVLVDGRSVYSTLFSGVEWDQQTVPVQDIERIEVIRGPGATIWGVNAVNGVINILTKRAGDAQGSYATARVGNQEQLGTYVRHGFELGENVSARLSGTMTHLNPNESAFGETTFDDGQRSRLSSRLDWTPSDADDVTFALDWFHTESGANTLTFREDYADLMGTLERSPTNVRGQSGILEWRHELSERNSVELSASFERLQRNATLIVAAERTVDLGFQQNLRLRDAHHVVWGFGARRYDGHVDSNNFLTFTDEGETLASYHAFAQDEIALTDSVNLTLGSKVSWNDYTGWEIQPSVRTLWKPSSTQSVWAAISRSVRTPSYGERSTQVTVLAIPAGPVNIPIRLQSDSDAEAEVMIAYELGYRAHLGTHFNVDVALFAHDYENLIERQPNLATDNTGEERSQGVEIAFNWVPVPKTRIRGSWSTIHLHRSDRTPHQNWQLHGSYDLTPRVELDLGLYYDGRRVFVDATGNDQRKGGELRTDARIAWTPLPYLSLALVGQNLFDRERVENFFITGPQVTTHIQRSVFVEASVAF